MIFKSTVRASDILSRNQSTTYTNNIGLSFKKNDKDLIIYYRLDQLSLSYYIWFICSIGNLGYDIWRTKLTKKYMYSN